MSCDDDLEGSSKPYLYFPRPSKMEAFLLYIVMQLREDAVECWNCARVQADMLSAGICTVNKVHV